TRASAAAPSPPNIHLRDMTDPSLRKQYVRVVTSSLPPKDETTRPSVCPRPRTRARARSSVLGGVGRARYNFPEPPRGGAPAAPRPGATRPPARRDGLLVIDKPAGVTSRAGVDHALRWFGRRTRLGHTGTLDPLATGVLVLCVGGATRLTEYVQRMGKTYTS